VFESFFDGAKSFSSKVYNQQFKGTLRSVRRLFSLKIDPDSEQNESLKTVLKFDQPLYDLVEKQAFSPYHEELGNQTEKLEDKVRKSRNPDKFGARNDFFNKPLYAGWDEKLRKFVITNKLLPRTFAGYRVNIEPKTRENFVTDSGKQVQKIKFTAWPLSINKVLDPETKHTVPYVTLFQPIDEKLKNTLSDGGGNDEEEDFVSLASSFRTVPSNQSKWLVRHTEKQKGKEFSLEGPPLAPKRGGFIWPGNSKLTVPSFSRS
jgi:hypothetical protein